MKVSDSPLDPAASNPPPRRPRHNFDEVFNNFKRQVQDDGVLKELKQREFFLPPAEKKKAKAIRALSRRKLARKANQEKPPSA